ncbi:MULTISPECIES: hypothetical protein [Pseudomonadaceae]|uniref:hypothetical protein n=1 Tax=Pseudomonadaceae TaxID=135621 RepID=UPI0015E2ED0D|nr:MULTISPECIES: hypothetical protein [Pseudomonadaceae]MBA1277636.1 hypothetical protein [Stutzerimonas stutzeri]QXY91150.1 hypothetical protein GYM54_05875 [Pseudomonas sp. MTM4]
MIEDNRPAHRAVGTAGHVPCEAFVTLPIQLTVGVLGDMDGACRPADQQGKA